MYLRIEMLEEGFVAWKNLILAIPPMICHHTRNKMVSKQY